MHETLTRRIRRYNEQFREQLATQAWFKLACVIPEENPCDACRAAEGDYAREALPPLPVPGCTRHDGCQCWYAALVGDQSRATAG
jgi:hypothetical protein